MHASLPEQITDLWDRRDQLSPDNAGALDIVRQAIDLLDRGDARVAEVSGDGVGDDEVVVNEWLKLAILLLFRLTAIETTELGPFEYADRIPLKRNYEAAGVRVVPGASGRWGSHLAKGVVLMPSYTNIGAYVGENSMVDTWATVGSCAQIGSNVHLSGGVGIGGVLEPPNASPVIVGDECMIGSRCILAEGARVGVGSILGAGCILTGSIPVYDADTGQEISRGRVPAWSVAVSATRPRTHPGGAFGLPCVLVIKHLEPGERHDKSKLNGILRDHGSTT